MKRDKKIILRLTQQELDRLNAMVAKTPYNRETFLRCMLEGYTLREFPKDYMQFRRQVVTIAYNLSRLSTNEMFTWQEQEELYSLIRQCQKLIQIMTDAFMEKGKERRNANDG